MNIQEITISNNQRKQLLRNEQLESVLFEDDNGDLIVNAAAYQELKSQLNPPPLEAILGDEALDFNAEFFVFS